jgi:hypothetical protein
MFFINGTTYWARNPDTYAFFRKQKPVTVPGRCLYVYKQSTLSPPATR